MNSNSFNLGEVLTKAWQIVWKFKVLWIFGIFAGCSNGGGGGGGGSGSGYRFDGSSFTDLPPELREFVRGMDQFGRWFENNLWIIAVIISVLCILFLVSVFLGTIGKIGLIKGTLMADDGAESLSFGEIWSASMPYFWRVLGFSLLFGLAIFIILMVFLLPVIIIGAMTVVGLFCVIPLLCLLVPAMWVVTVISEQAIIAMIVEDRNMLDGLTRGWEVVRTNVGQYILVALVLFIGGGIIGMIIAIPVFLIIFPAVLTLVISEGTAWSGMMLAGLCFVVYLPVAIVLGGILTAYIQSAWTLTYRRLTMPLALEPETNEPLDLADAPA